jgi:methyl-accepting chemotaxis protein
MVALEKSYAVIEFKPDGTILRANDNFLKTLGYDADEVVGKHHRMFVEPEGAASPDYVIFWADLRGGSANLDSLDKWIFGLSSA